ncbi:MAG: hypothetical protein IT345_09775 [Trueperaceae bacterium]|nr:hypothetical protein [Trueperaceae bacterium]
MTGETFPIGSHGLVDDFISSSLAIPAAGSAESGMPWAKKIVGAAPPTVAGVAAATNGVIACTLTSDDQKQNAEVYTGDELNFSMVQGLAFEARINPAVLPTLVAEMVFGVIGAWADGLDAVTYSAFFTMDGSGEIFCEKDDNATDQSVTSGVTLTTSDWAICKLLYDPDSATVKFYINGQRVAESTSFSWAASTANSKVQPVFGCYKATGAGVGTLYCDYVKVWQARS